MKRDLTITLLIVFIYLAIIGGTIVWTVSVWKECRAAHSWSYCVKVMA